MKRVNKLDALVKELQVTQQLLANLQRRVLVMHHPGNNGYNLCPQCKVTWPCPTVKSV